MTGTTQHWYYLLNVNLPGQMLSIPEPRNFIFVIALIFFSFVEAWN